MNGNYDLTIVQRLGILVFVFCCGIPAMEINGYGMGLITSMPFGLLLATLGGMVGGAMVCSSPIAAGMIGGVLAGPMGLLAVYLYTAARTEVYDLELVVVQLIASLPGFAVGWLIKKVVGG